MKYLFNQKKVYLLLRKILASTVTLNNFALFMFDNSNILITGGTGSFGKAFVRYVLANHEPEKDGS